MKKKCFFDRERRRPLSNELVLFVEHPVDPAHMYYVGGVFRLTANVCMFKNLFPQNIFAPSQTFFGPLSQQQQQEQHTLHHSSLKLLYTIS